MARTRAQEKADADGKQPTTTIPPKRTSTKGKTPAKRSEPEPDDDPREEPAGGEADEEGDGAAGQPPTKVAKTEGDDDAKQATSGAETDDPKIKKLLEDYGAFPLQDTKLKEPTKPTPETMLAHLLNAMLTSTRISHQLAAKTVRTVIEAGYCDLLTLEKSTWEERTEVLTEGGYTHYREKTATQFGDLASWLRQNYSGDVNNVLGAAKSDTSTDHVDIRNAVRKRLEEIKGLGSVALDIFCDTAQGLWTDLAPFLDQRSDKAAAQARLPTDVGELYAMVGNDPVKMCRLAAALTTVRLEKEVDEIAQEGEEA